MQSLALTHLGMLVRHAPSNCAVFTEQLLEQAANLRSLSNKTTLEYFSSLENLIRPASELLKDN